MNFETEQPADNSSYTENEKNDNKNNNRAENIDYYLRVKLMKVNQKLTLTPSQTFDEVEGATLCTANNLEKVVWAHFDESTENDQEHMANFSNLAKANEIKESFEQENIKPEIDFPSAQPKKTLNKKDHNKKERTNKFSSPSHQNQASQKTKDFQKNTEIINFKEKKTSKNRCSSVKVRENSKNHLDAEKLKPIKNQHLKALPKIKMSIMQYQSNSVPKKTFINYSTLKYLVLKTNPHQSIIEILLSLILFYEGYLNIKLERTWEGIKKVIEIKPGNIDRFYQTIGITNFLIDADKILPENVINSLLCIDKYRRIENDPYIKYTKEIYDFLMYIIYFYKNYYEGMNECKQVMQVETKLNKDYELYLESLKSPQNAKVWDLSFQNTGNNQYDEVPTDDTHQKDRYSIDYDELNLVVKVDRNHESQLVTDEYKLKTLRSLIEKASPDRDKITDDIDKKNESSDFPVDYTFNEEAKCPSLSENSKNNNKIKNQDYFSVDIERILEPEDIIFQSPQSKSYENKSNGARSKQKYLYESEDEISPSEKISNKVKELPETKKCNEISPKNIGNTQIQVKSAIEKKKLSSSQNRDGSTSPKKNDSKKKILLSNAPLTGEFKINFQNNQTNEESQMRIETKEKLINNMITLKEYKIYKTMGLNCIEVVILLKGLIYLLAGTVQSIPIKLLNMENIEKGRLDKCFTGTKTFEALWNLELLIIENKIKDENIAKVMHKIDEYKNLPKKTDNPHIQKLLNFLQFAVQLYEIIQDENVTTSQHNQKSSN